MFSIICKTIFGIMLIIVALIIYNIKIVSPTGKSIIIEEDLSRWAFPALFTYIEENTLKDCINLRKYNIKEGVLIGKVAKESTLSASGFDRGDVILMYNGERVQNPKQFIELLDITFPNKGAKFIVVKKCKIMLMILNHSLN